MGAGHGVTALYELVPAGQPVPDPGRGYAEASEDIRFAAGVAVFAMLLRNSPYKRDASFALVQE
jgi:hypothetical protein